MQEYAWSLAPLVAPFAARVAPLGERIAIAQTLLKLTCPGVPDIYQGDELECLSLVDPDNRHPVDWDARRRAIAAPPAKLRLIREALGLRSCRPEAFAGAYGPVSAGRDVLAFTRGEVLVSVPLRPDAVFDPGAGWGEVAPGLYERS